MSTSEPAPYSPAVAIPPSTYEPEGDVVTEHENLLGRGRGLNERHGDHFLAVEPEPFREGWLGKALTRLTCCARPNQEPSSGVSAWPRHQPYRFRQPCRRCGVTFGSVQVGRWIRSNHPHAYRTGEWGRVVALNELSGRPGWLIEWADEVTDVWVQDDPDAGYEFTDDPLGAP